MLIWVVMQALYIDRYLSSTMPNFDVTKITEKSMPLLSM